MAPSANTRCAYWASWATSNRPACSRAYSWMTAWRSSAPWNIWVVKAVIGGIGSPLKKGATAKRSEEHTSELQSLMRISYAVFCLQKKKPRTAQQRHADPENRRNVLTPPVVLVSHDQLTPMRKHHSSIMLAHQK